MVHCDQFVGPKHQRQSVGMLILSEASSQGHEAVVGCLLRRYTCFPSLTMAPPPAILTCVAGVALGCFLWLPLAWSSSLATSLFAQLPSFLATSNHLTWSKKLRALLEPEIHAHTRRAGTAKGGLVAGCLGRCCCGVVELRAGLLCCVSKVMCHIRLP